jgi:hypothetical protein
MLVVTGVMLPSMAVSAVVFPVLEVVAACTAMSIVVASAVAVPSAAIMAVVGAMHAAMRSATVRRGDVIVPAGSILARRVLVPRIARHVAPPGFMPVDPFDAARCLRVGLRASRRSSNRREQNDRRE